MLMVDKASTVHRPLKTKNSNRNQKKKRVRQSDCILFSVYVVLYTVSHDAVLTQFELPLPCSDGAWPDTESCDCR